MDPAHIERLKQEQRKAIEQTEQAMNQLLKFKEDYAALNDRLETLPDKISHDIMVPFGKLAFMPGKIVHTNEITVLLGDNWFAERSAKQAREIVGRRIEALEKQIEDLEMQKGLLEPRQEFTDEIAALGNEKEDVKEIREEYDEEKEKIWKTEHRKKMREYKIEERMERERVLAEEEKTKEVMSDADVWARLDELERQEREGRELLKLDDDLQAGLVPTSTEASSEWHGERRKGEKARSRLEGEEDEESSTDEEETIRPATIKFIHTKTNHNHGVSFGENTEKSKEAPTITSPADIYKMFIPDKPKSILKSPSQPSPGFSQAQNVGFQKDLTRVHYPPVPAKPQPIHVGPSAFTGSIVERKVADTPASEEASSNPPQRISKFKAQRMKQRQQ